MRICAAELRHDLQARRALPGDDRGIVEARDDGRTALARDPRCNLLAALAAAVVQDNLGAFAARALDLHARRVGRHHNDSANAQPFRRDRDPAGVVAGRKGHDASRPFFGRKLQQTVGRAPQLEGTAGLQALAFKPQPNPAELAFNQGRAGHESIDPRRRIGHVLARDFMRSG